MTALPVSNFSNLSTYPQPDLNVTKSTIDSKPSSIEPATDSKSEDRRFNQEQRQTALKINQHNHHQHQIETYLTVAHSDDVPSNYSSEWIEAIDIFVEQSRQYLKQTALDQNEKDSENTISSSINLTV
ncbi:MAG: hypothetical protein OQK12_11775 [Motiliproteus sp.]|nr:hypothetical protein [Motiliproteus sp.]MCW9051373.1 hypothetical protein [Motiliproteus sp.]